MVHWMGIEPAPPHPYRNLSNNQSILTVTHGVGPGQTNWGSDVYLVASLLKMQQRDTPLGTRGVIPTSDFNENVGFWIFYQQWLFKHRGHSQAEVDGIVSPVRPTRAARCGDYSYAPGRPYFIVLLNLEARRHFPDRYAAMIAQEFNELGNAIVA